MPLFKITSRYPHGNKTNTFLRRHESWSDANKAWKSNQRVRFKVEELTDPPPLSLWWDFLDKHDWYYGMSDDHNTVRRGAVEDQLLQSLVTTFPQQHQDMHHQFCRWAFWNEKGERPDKPDRPKE